MDDAGGPRVVGVSASPAHTMAKGPRPAITLVVGFGVDGDAHGGATVKHRSRVARDPSQPNLRQVHLIGAELHQQLARRGLVVAPGEMGENVTTAGVDLLGLPTGTRLHLGPSAVVEVTGLRNPCRQLDGVRPGLLAATRPVIDGRVTRLAGVMAIVVAGGSVRPGDPVLVEVPEGPHRPLEPV